MCDEVNKQALSFRKKEAHFKLASSFLCFKGDSRSRSSCASEAALKWRFARREDDDPLIGVFGAFLPSSK